MLGRVKMDLGCVYGGEKTRNARRAQGWAVEGEAEEMSIIRSERDWPLNCDRTNVSTGFSIVHGLFRSLITWEYSERSDFGD